MSPSGFDALSRRIGQLEREMSGETARRKLVGIGMDAKKDAVEAVRKDLGDESMSGWWRATARRPNRKPIPVVTAFDVVSDTELQIMPRGASAGPWRVLEQGRKAGTKGDASTYRKRRTTKARGTFVAEYTRTRKRNSGSTPAKHTWTEAVQLITERTPKRVHEVFVVQPMTKLFKG